MSAISPDNQPSRGRLVVWGLLGAYPFGGMTWQVLHYLAALRQLGFDVWYVEETRANSLSADNFSPTQDHTANLKHVRKWMHWLGLEDRWVYSPPSQPDVYFGALDKAGLDRLYREVDAAFNLCGAQELRPHHANIQCLVYVETDPVQKQVYLAQGKQHWKKLFAAYDYRFTYAENINHDDCEIPPTEFSWLTTRPPVYLPWWKTVGSPPQAAKVTSVATWKHKGKDIHWNGQVWRWSKHHGFLEYIDIPLKANLPMELAVGGIKPSEMDYLRTNNWHLLDPKQLGDPEAYRDYVSNSLAEFTVAKEQYVKPNTGWFSDRSVCYLAAGRPVITMETGFSKFIPSGEGLFGYRSKDEVWTAIDAIATDYSRQSQRALDIASDYFDAGKVVSRMMADVGLL
jgi:hypothetical protein